MKVSVYDTTLRDGNQTYNVNFTFEDKIELIKKFDKFGIDYIEIGWPRPESIDSDVMKKVPELNLRNSKIAVFGSTRKLKNKAEDDPLLNTLIESNAKVATIFGKSWLMHVEKQLKGTAQENLDAIYDSIHFLKNNNKNRFEEVFFDAEHYFDGFKDNPSFAVSCLIKAIEAGANCVILCDTNGGMLPFEIHEIIKTTKKELDSKFGRENYSIGIHCHDDCGCAVAASLQAVLAGAAQIQGTFNGLGERVGNANLSTIIPNIALKKPLSSIKLNDNITSNLNKITELAKEVSDRAGLVLPENQPYVGRRAFVHDGGVHVDAILKGAKYEAVDPTSVGNKTRISMSSNTGKAGARYLLEKMGFDPSDENKVNVFLDAVHKLSEKGQNLGLFTDECYYIARMIYDKKRSDVKINRAQLSTDYLNGELNRHDDSVLMDIEINGESFELIKRGTSGQVGVAHELLRNAMKKKGLKDDFRLVDYHVSLPKERSGAHSYTQTTITYELGNGKRITVTGFDDNVIISSLNAMRKAAELIIEGYKQNN